jgi:hypothetical protein
MEENIFKMYWHDWDETWDETFFHPNKTEESFQMDTQLLLRKYTDEFIDTRNGEYINMVDLLIYISDKMPELGYVKLKPKYCSFNGGNIMRRVDDEDCVFWVSRIGERLVERICETNQKVWDRMDDEMERRTE